MAEAHEISNDSNNETLDEVIAARVSRRGFLGGGLATAAVSLGGVGALLDALGSSLKAGDNLVTFEAIPVSSADAISLAKGYRSRVLIAWGDPVSDGPAFKQDASNTSAEQALQWGMHNDGLVYFPLDGSDRGLLVQNNEYTDDVLLFQDGVANWNAEKTQKSLNAHGISIVEISKLGGAGVPRGEWRIVRPSRYARRITGQTPIKIGGPVSQPGQPAADRRLVTSADPTGRDVRGTLNNCAIGSTPWGTFLSCEENFNGYFRKKGAQTLLEQRYGINATGANYLWHTTDARFSVDDEPNEANRFGWVIEVDPRDPASVPVKRTALGRLKHEGAKVQEALDGRIVVYMGDDEQFEYIYRYVSRAPWREMRAGNVSPLDGGELSVAKFKADGQGEWIALTPAHAALAKWSLNDILINTRGAADAVGATKLDRPEWIDTIPEFKTVLATLTNNSARGTGGTNPRTSQPNSDVDATNPRKSNVYGHILRWTNVDDFTDSTFAWDIYALGGDPLNKAHGSTIVGDRYGSPDGLFVAPSTRVWIQTDVSSSTINSGAYEGFGNNQMLCSDPETGDTRRFLVGPRGCEVTGVTVTPDERTMFVGIQHPGEAPAGTNDPANPKQYSSWPDGDQGGRPRSACLVITKIDGGPIGS